LRIKGLIVKNQGFSQAQHKGWINEFWCHETTCWRSIKTRRF